MPNTVYDNFVLENKLESILTTKVDMNRFVTPDYSLTENPGMKKIIHRYTASGNVQELNMGEGNTQDITASFTPVEYTVGVTQGRATYFDEEAMRDPMVVDTLVNGLAETMINDFTKKAINEMQKAQLGIVCDFTTSTAGYMFDKVVDALALLGEDEEGYTLLISPANQAYIRKQLRNDLVYSEDYVRTGYIGHISGVPVVVSKAVPDTCAFLVNKAAITLFVKKGAEAEQDRDPNTRKNEMYLRKVGLVALTNPAKLVVLGNAQATSCTISAVSANDTSISGTCGTACTLVTVVDGNGVSYDVIPSAGSWSVDTVSAQLAGQTITASAIQPGFAPATATPVTVA